MPKACALLAVKDLQGPWAVRKGGHLPVVSVVSMLGARGANCRIILPSSELHNHTPSHLL